LEFPCDIILQISHFPLISAEFNLVVSAFALDCSDIIELDPQDGIEPVDL
jgi:hypothetical protein